MKIVLIVLSVVAALSAQVNFSGWNDTAAVANFQGDSAGVTRAFELSRYENIRLSVCADDTTEAGFSSDSIGFQWGIEIGDVIKNTSGKRDTTWQERYVVDTFDVTVSANMVKPYKVLDSIGNYTMTKLFIDTVNVTGLAVQDREPFYVIPWAPIFRFWYAGLDGNRDEDGYIRLIFGQSRREYNIVHNQ